MKKFIFIPAFILIGTLSALAQFEDESPLFRIVFNQEKRSMVEEFMDLSPDEANKFWPIYNDYEDERTKLGTVRIRLLEEYADKYQTLTDEQADALIGQAIKIQQQTLDLQKKYYGKIKKALSARQAAGWLQLENYIESAIRLEITKRVPFVGEE